MQWEEEDVYRRKFLISLILAFTILFVDTTSGFAREFDFEWQFSCGDVFEAENVVGTRYDISAPNSKAITIISQKNGNLEVRFNSAGDFYVVAHLPDGKKYFYHLMVGRKNSSMIEQNIENNNNNFAQEILQLVNKERTLRRLPPLYLSRDLTDAATIRAQEIIQRYSHTRPDGSECFTVLKSMGRTVGENIAAGQQTPKGVMNAWMNSKGHRDNILNPKFREIGIGYSFKHDSKYRWYWTQIFRG